MRNSLLSVDSIFHLTDSLIHSTNDARERNFQRWDFSEQTYNQKVLELKDWIIQRLAWMDQNMFGECDHLDQLLDLKYRIKIVDILGRETSNKGFQLHIYNDGSVEKKYLTK